MKRMTKIVSLLLVAFLLFGCTKIPATTPDLSGVASDTAVLTEAALTEIMHEMQERVAYFESQNKLIEAQRIRERVLYDVEMLREIGFCSGVENYSRVLSGRPAGSTPFTL